MCTLMCSFTDETNLLFVCLMIDWLLQLKASETEMQRLFCNKAESTQKLCSGIARMQRLIHLNISTWQSFTSCCHMQFSY